MAINQLDEETINRIAAGEVIERPASVVKELIENSIDAGADKIDVLISDGGRNKIVVEDNGSGMSSDDAQKSILRHTTSKIRDYNDLWSILTMGFRGEALSSIASVSKLSIITKQENEDGVKVECEGGEIKGKKAFAANNGTKIIVNELFYNVPARKKFLKSRNYEQKQITDVVSRYALIHTNKAFTLRNDEGVLIEKPKVSSIKENIAAVYGVDVAKESFIVNKDGVRGRIAKPTINRASRDYMSVYVNKRFVKSKIAEDAIMDAMKTLIFHDRYPIAVINLDIEPREVDVNVHPAKRIIKFKDENEIYQRVFDAVINGMQAADLFSTSKAKPKQHILGEGPEKKEKPKESYFQKRNDTQSFLAAEEEGEYQLDVNIMGQIHKTYIIIETEEGYSIVDQHAAEERINYEKLREQYENEKVERQELLNGCVLELTATEFSSIIENSNVLGELGFYFEEFGKNSIILRQIPATISLEYDLKDTILTLLEKVGRNTARDEKKEESLKYMACRSSVKAGEELNFKEMKKLIKKLFETNNKYTCPHGRPTMLRYPLQKLEKDFKRTE
ncbi:MAG: DNA mismatch repair endonuclease MutL [Candidatus Nanoarchaeia archaeon]